MHLRIQTKDIRGAKRDCYDHCPIARAIRRTFPGNTVQVFDRSMLVNGWDFDHTEESRQFVDEWNEGETPRAQTIEIPDIRDRLRVHNSQLNELGGREEMAAVDNGRER